MSKKGEQNNNERVNKKYKDSLFVDLFYEDENAKENELSLYNALFGTDYKLDDVRIDKIRVEGIIYMKLKNDVSFNMQNRLLVFCEHQSTINENMPLRDLMYAGRAYEQLVPIEDRYKRTGVKIPRPIFYVFYNGKAPIKDGEILKLSDLYLDTEEEDSVSLEVIVKVININSDSGSEVLEKCPVLREYSEFVEKIREYKALGAADYMKQAITYCIEHHILEEYLKRKGSDVMGFLCAEYDYEMDIAVQKEESFEDGLKKGEEFGKIQQIIMQVCKKLAKGKNAEQIADELEEDVEEIKEIYDIAAKYAPEYNPELIYSEYVNDKSK